MIETGSREFHCLFIDFSFMPFSSKGRSSTDIANIISVKLRCACVKFPDRNGVAQSCCAKSSQNPLTVNQIRLLIGNKELVIVVLRPFHGLIELDIVGILVGVSAMRFGKQFHLASFGIRKVLLSLSFPVYAVRSRLFEIDPATTFATLILAYLTPESSSANL